MLNRNESLSAHMATECFRCFLPPGAVLQTYAGDSMLYLSRFMQSGQYRLCVHACTMQGSLNRMSLRGVKT